MCGIAGYAGTHRPELLPGMCRAMGHRGPDDEGFWHNEACGVGLGHRRLSIIDVSQAGHQPMVSTDGHTIIAYNGEVYNFPELRQELEREGRAFHSRTDTEVILQLYERDGLACLQRLNGMFAFAIWDGRTKRLLLARDHAGVKPLYYWQTNGAIYFASELKALLKIPGVPRTINHAAIVDYLTFLWVPGAETMLAGIRKLEPGHYLTWDGGRVTIAPWFSLTYDPDPNISLADATDAVRSAMTRAVHRQMVSDVPLGAFLSGGLDSSAIAAAMRAAFPDREITAYTAVFPPGEIAEEQGVDDLPYAERVARHLGLTLSRVEIRPNVIELLPLMIYHLDEPDSDPAIFPSYLIANRARDDGIKVLLSGTGGDEVFFGYRSHVALGLYQRLDYLPRWPTTGAMAAASRGANGFLGHTHILSRRIRKFVRGFTAASGVPRHMALVDWSEPQVRERLLLHRDARQAMQSDASAYIEQYSTAFRGCGHLNHHSHILIQTFLAAHNFLYTDRTSMAASIEVRVPFMDLELMQLAARLPENFKQRGKVSKLVLKKAMESRLPEEVIYRSKVGFGAPLRRWLRDDLNGVIRDTLSADKIRERGLFDLSQVEAILRSNDNQTADHAYLIYALINFELWAQTFVDRPGEPVTL